MAKPIVAQAHPESLKEAATRVARLYDDGLIVPAPGHVVADRALILLEQALYREGVTIRPRRVSEQVMAAASKAGAK